MATSIFYEVLDNGSLILVEEESPIMSAAKQLPVRVIARLDKKLIIDPSSLIVTMHLIFGLYTLEHLWIRSGILRIMVGNFPCLINSTKVLPFFTYSVAFGRNFMLSLTESIPAGKKYWDEGNVSSS